MTDEQFKKLTDLIGWGLLWLFCIAVGTCTFSPSNSGVERQLKRIADHLEATPTP